MRREGEGRRGGRRERMVGKEKESRGTERRHRISVKFGGSKAFLPKNICWKIYV